MFDSVRCEVVPPHLDEMEPGPALAAFLSSIEVDRVSGHDRVVVLRAYQRMAAHYQAMSWKAMGSIVDEYDPAGERRSGDVEMAATEVRVALAWTRRAADAEVAIALEVGERLPRVWEALVAGRIDRQRARVLAEGTGNVPDDTARAVIDRIIDGAPGLTTGQLRARLRRLCIETDPDHACKSLARAQCPAQQARPGPREGDLGASPPPPDARHTGWAYRRLPNGDHEWTSPLGHTYTTTDQPP